MSNKYFSSIHWCNCPKKFGGQHCEIDKSKTCYEGNGHFYRGKASTDTMGRSCLAWNSATVLQQTYHAHRSDALQLGLGKHNYCRNPDNRRRPWCYVQVGLKQLVQECMVHNCADGKKPASPPEELQFQCGQRTLRPRFKIVGENSPPSRTSPGLQPSTGGTGAALSPTCVEAASSALAGWSAPHTASLITQRRRTTLSTWVAQGLTPTRKGR